MKTLKKYYCALFVSACFFVFLIIMDINAVKGVKKFEETEKYNKNATELKKKEIRRTYGYAEMLEELRDSKFIILHIDDDKNGVMRINAQFHGNLKEFMSYMNKLYCYENFQGIDNITITGNKSKINVYMNFIKDK